MCFDSMFGPFQCGLSVDRVCICECFCTFWPLRCEPHGHTFIHKKTLMLGQIITWQISFSTIIPSTIKYFVHFLFIYIFFLLQGQYCKLYRRYIHAHIGLIIGKIGSLSLIRFTLNRCLASLNAKSSMMLMNF